MASIRPRTSTVLLIVSASALGVSLAALGAPEKAPVARTQPTSTQTTAHGGIGLKPVDCVAELGKFTATSVPANGTVVVNGDAYGGIPDSQVALVDGKVKGGISVALPGHDPDNPNVCQASKAVIIEMRVSGAQVILKWSIDNLTFQAPVSACAGHLWMASTGKSAITIRAGS
jgi:hypothetical protein